MKAGVPLTISAPMNYMTRASRFPFALRLASLGRQTEVAREALALQPESWVAHFNASVYEGEWQGAPLIGPAGETHPVRQIYSDPSATEFAATEILGRCPATAQVLGWFDCRIRSARFLALAPGALIREHRDHALGWEDGQVRLHIPVQTHADVIFMLAGQRVPLMEGEVWYLNVNQLHSVRNDSPVQRIHLVVDVDTNLWLESAFERALKASSSA
jgi:hypothetical protein